MTSGTKTVTVFLTVICGLILTAFGVAAHWPGWLWSVMAVMLLAVPALAVKAAEHRGGPVPAELEPYLTPPPVERREERVLQVALPSSWDDYDFLFSATVRWCPTGAAATEPVVNPAGLAVDAVLERARRITEQRDPSRASLVQYELNGALGRMRPDATGYLQAMAEDVTLVLSEHDRERLEKLAAVRKDKAVWEHQHKHEQSKREYLAQDVLKDTGSAVVWWLARNDDQVDKTVKDLGLLAQLTSAANNEDVPERLQHLVPGARPWNAPDAPSFQADATPSPADGPGNTDSGSADSGQDREPSATDLYDAFLRRMGFSDGDVCRSLITRQIVEVIKRYDKIEAADQLLRRFDAPDGPGFSDDTGFSGPEEPGGPDRPDDPGFPPDDAGGASVSRPPAPNGPGGGPAPVGRTVPHFAEDGRGN
ncbi:hypothetical protein [Streptomyces sp. HB2AG]|uniref:hypothetical protein n=1 Tax=Streptomyces sp. HB2AG TaxID=2983400 RepID=UPI0022AB2C0D|nr:hypothetical protein [Streptomyces sp. HB2AG]MCZ2525368.1 hypothetical protein [Streptomyces sp. HB2AG]